MLFPPKEITSKWPKPNYVNPHKQEGFMRPVLIFLIVITFIVVGLRFYVRAIILRSFKLDDWFMIPATLCTTAMTICNYISENYGVGTHIWDVPIPYLGKVRMYSFITQLTFTSAVVFTKVSILLFYLRFCTSRKFRLWIHGTMGFVVFWFTVWIFMIIFQCVPVQAYWSPPHPGDKCLKYQDELHLLHGSTNLLTDVLILVLPIPTVLKLQMPFRQKATLIGVFSLGVIAPISAILRLVYIHEATSTWDSTWWCMELWIYTSLEAHVGILCASIPSLKPLVIRLFPRFASSSHSGNQNSSPMGFNDSGSNSVNRHRFTIGGSGPHSQNSAIKSGKQGKSKTRSLYPLNSIIAMGEDERSRNESQESIVGKGSDSESIAPPVPPKNVVVKTTEIHWEVRGGSYRGDDRNV